MDCEIINNLALFLVGEERPYFREFFGKDFVNCTFNHDLCRATMLYSMQIYQLKLTRKSIMG
jgi:hypothetical protein